MPLASRDVLEGRLPPASRPSSWDVCGAICKLGAAQTWRAAGLELHGEGAARDRWGGCSPPAPAGSAGGRLCGAPRNCGVQLPWDGPALALTCSWGLTFWTQGSGRAGGAAVTPHHVGPDLQAPALSLPGLLQVELSPERTREAQPCGPHHPLAGRTRSLPGYLGHGQGDGTRPRAPVHPRHLLGESTPLLGSLPLTPGTGAQLHGTCPGSAAAPSPAPHLPLGLLCPGAASPALQHRPAAAPPAPRRRAEPAAAALPASGSLLASPGRAETFWEAKGGERRSSSGINTASSPPPARCSPAQQRVCAPGPAASGTWARGQGGGC